jgi:hypothetical protein
VRASSVSGSSQRRVHDGPAEEGAPGGPGTASEDFSIPSPSVMTGSLQQLSHIRGWHNGKQESRAI